MKSFKIGLILLMVIQGVVITANAKDGQKKIEKLRQSDNMIELTEHKAILDQKVDMVFYGNLKSHNNLLQLNNLLVKDIIEQESRAKIFGVNKEIKKSVYKNNIIDRQQKNGD